MLLTQSTASYTVALLSVSVKEWKPNVFMKLYERK